MVDTIKIADANRAFSDALKRNSQLISSENNYMDAAGQSQSARVSFGDLLESSVRGAIEKGKISEQRSVDAVFKKIDLPELVTSIQEAEVALQTVATVRNKVIRAYQEIIKMPV
jgi:flagellar hook-basal body complex protein FliE